MELYGNEIKRALDLAGILGTMEVNLFWIDDVDQMARLDPGAIVAGGDTFRRRGSRRFRRFWGR